MNERFIKEIGIISKSQYNILKNSLVILFGLGGVGGYAFEMLVRVGIENFIIIDKDKFEVSNINRQLVATDFTIGKFKTEVYAERALSINNDINIIRINIKIDKANIETVFNNINNFKNISYIYTIDCIDDVNAKIAIIKYCHDNNIKIISSMGTANHCSTNNVKISDIKDTKYCPLAKRIRKILKTENIESLDCLYINEEPINFNNNEISTISYVPSLCGIKIAEYVIKKII